MSDHLEARATDTDVPACRLSPGALHDRVGEWRSLMTQASARESREGRVRTTYPNSPEVAQRLAELIAAEKECCSFLQFDVQERGGVLEVELRYPPEFAPLLAAVTAS